MPEILIRNTQLLILLFSEIINIQVLFHLIGLTEYTDKCGYNPGKTRAYT